MILQLIQHQGFVLAVNNVGQLIVWDITPKAFPYSLHRFDNNVSLVPSVGVRSIGQKQLIGITHAGNTIVLYSKYSIFMFDFSHLREVFEEGCQDTVREVQFRQYMQENQRMTCVDMVGERSVIVGTSNSYLFLFDLGEQKILNKRSLWNQIKKQTETVQFSTNFAKIPEITTIALLSNCELVLVGLDSGKIITVETTELLILNEVTLNVRSPLQRIAKLYLKEREDKVYSLHQNYIIQWNFKLNSCLEYIQYSGSSGIVKQNDILYIGGGCGSLTRMDKGVKQIQLSMRSTGTVKELGSEIIGVGGADSLVDIFIDNMRLMTLFPN